MIDENPDFILAKANVALFIDADNASAAKINFIINELASYGSVIIRKAYGNWDAPNLSAWKLMLLEHAIVPIQQYDYTKGKNATDMAMCIDVMDLMYKGHVDIFCLVSSDSDFTPLATRLLSEGKMVIGFGENKTPKAFVNACSKFIYLETPSIKKKDSNQEDTPFKKSGSQLKQDTSLMNLLRNAVKAAEDDTGWANLGPVGSIISNQASFDSKNYGYNKLSDLIKAIDLFETKYTNNNSRLLVKRKR